MDKEDLIKLAEIAGIQVKWNEEFEWEDPCFMVQEDDVDVHYWRPHEDLNQAFEVLESTGYKWTLQSVEDCMDKIVYVFADRIAQGYAATLSEAICQAVLKASNNEQGEQR